MIIFKAFLKVLNKYKATVILYTVILVFFAGFNMKDTKSNQGFIAKKPDVLIVNNDTNQGLTKDLIDYISKNVNIISIEIDEDKINDAVFYRNVNYVIYIPEKFREDFLSNKNPKIEIKSTGDYQASLASLILERYMKVATIYNNKGMDEASLISNINNTLNKEIEVEVTSKLDNDNLSKLTSFYNFSNYSFLASVVFIICLVLTSFRDEKINKRNIVSSTNYKKFNQSLLFANIFFACLLWLIYVLLSLILFGNIVFTLHGLLYIINSFFFIMCAVTIAILLANIINNKDAISGIVNVIALGSSFLCGAFVPMDFLPQSVIKIAHILPSYWFIKNNELIKTLETFSWVNIKSFMFNLAIIGGFMIMFISLNNLVSKCKRKKC